MKKYLLIGKSPQMRMVLLRDPKTGLFEQHKIRQGLTREITEEQMTFHVERQAGFGILRCVELEEKVVVPEPVVEEFVEAPVIEWQAPEIGPGVEVDEIETEELEVPKPRKRRTRRKKAETE